MWKEATVNSFKALSRHCPEELRQTTYTANKIIIVRAEIRTLHLANATEKRYRLIQFASPGVVLIYNISVLM
jgi:hypothetical protein